VKPTTHESRNASLGNPKNRKPLKNLPK